MLNPDAISSALEALSERRLASARSREMRSLKGVRGVPDGDVARICSEAWRNGPPAFPDDEEALSRLFSTAWEDGIVAVGILAALVPDHPADCFEIGLEWLERADDLGTADALGWMVLGPAVAAAGLPLVHLLEPLKGRGHFAPRRAAVMAGMPWTGHKAEGPAAGALRARLGVKTIRWVDAPLDAHLTTLANTFLRDEDPRIRKALRRVLRGWADNNPHALMAWGDNVSGGLPKLLKAEVERAARRAKRADQWAAEHPDEVEQS